MEWSEVERRGERQVGGDDARQIGYSTLEVGNEGWGVRCFEG